MDSTARANTWSVTINNPTGYDEECIQVARQRGWKVEGQPERGKEGTPHYQLMVKTPQVRFSAVKKAFPRAHIEVARDAHALKAYVHKEETREGELPTQQEMYPSLSKFWDLVTDYYNVDGRDGLDLTHLPEVRFYTDENERLFKESPLVFLDEATRALIKRGYHVESITCNPSTRMAWKSFARELMYRSMTCREKATLEHPEIDRQTDSGESTQEIVVPTSITNAPSRPPSYLAPPCPNWKGEGPWAEHSCSACSSV